MFHPPLQKSFDIFCIHIIFLKYQQFFLINKFFNRFVCASHHFKNVQAIIFLKFLIKRSFIPRQWLQKLIKLQKHGKHIFYLSYLLIMATPCSWPIKEDINFKLSNLGSNIKASILWTHISSHLVKK
jgi:hypothetical protein